MLERVITIIVINADEIAEPSTTQGNLLQDNCTVVRLRTHHSTASPTIHGSIFTMVCHMGRVHAIVMQIGSTYRL